ncbi:MAG: hypothetical protein V3Q69_03255 [Burkholderia sp.]
MTGYCLGIADQYATTNEVAICFGVINRMWRTSLVRNPFVSPKIMLVDAIASSRSVYATTPLR